MSDILDDLCSIEYEAGRVGLQLNCSKCGIISHEPVAIGKFLCAVLGIQVVNPDVATLPGSPIGGLENTEGFESKT